jgi:hypothetical protein
MFQIVSDTVDCGDELDCGDESEMVFRGEIATDGGEEVRRVDLDVDEDVEGFDGSLVDGDEAGVAVVD